MFLWRKILAHGLKRLATPALHLWRIQHGLVEELALCIKSLATPGVNRRDGVVVRASASQSVDLGFIPLVESYQKTFKNGIYSFPAWRSAFMGGCGEQAGKVACCVLGQGT